MYWKLNVLLANLLPSQLPPPSWPLPRANVSKGGSSRLIPNGKSVASEGTADDSSPPFFDVEVDASSSAAASIAAMKEAMVKAQAKLRSAKEFMDRKMSKIVDECDSLRDEGLQSSCDREDNGMKFSVREEKQKVMTAQEVLDSVGEKLLKVAKESAEKRLGKKSSSYLGFAKIDGGSEWIEESQFFELVRTDKSDKALEQTNHVQISVHNTKNP
ncbi:auxilin-like protein 1 [Fagus crenata]